MGLRAEFVGAGKDSGPMRDLYFKILPKGTCSIAGCLVGFPVLDVRPYGLGHSVQYTTHCFEELGVALPRLEIARRSDYLSAMSVYLDTDGERCAALGGAPGALPGDQCRLLHEKASRVDAAAFPCAVADCGACLLQPKEEALVPAVWDRPLAEGAHYCVSTAGTQLDTGLEAQPGVCGGESSELMIAIRNASEEPVTVERGMPLALPVGLVEAEALDDYVDVLAGASEGVGDPAGALSDSVCASLEELAPCDVEPGDQLSIPLDRVPSLSTAAEELMDACAGKSLSLDALTLHGVNPPLGCTAEQLYYAAALLCEALETCLGWRRFWWTDVVV